MKLVDLLPTLLGTPVYLCIYAGISNSPPGTKNYVLVKVTDVTLFTIIMFNVNIN